MASVYLILGGNLGDKKAVFAEALSQLSDRVGRMEKRSAIYETEPWGFQSDDVFWNQVVELETTLLPEEVLARVMQIEKNLGRVRQLAQYGSRIIDIDILFYDQEIISLENLVVPHPRIAERKFVLVPLCEIAPQLVHPVFRKTVEQLLSECTDQLNVTRISR